MDVADDSQHFENTAAKEQSPALLTVILDTNLAAWALLADTLSLSTAVANLLVFINAHLACNYTNKVAVIASHCDKARWLYPTSSEQKPPGVGRGTRQDRNQKLPLDDRDDGVSEPVKRLKLNVKKYDSDSAASNGTHESNKYRPFRLVEEELIENLSTLLAGTPPDIVHTQTSTMVAGALTLALSYIHREVDAYSESISGVSKNVADSSSHAPSAANSDSVANALSNSLQARILLITISPSTDLAHQYIPIMNSIFACQRLGIPIDVLQLPLPQSTNTLNENSTVFLQQAADATHGIFIPAQLAPFSSPSRPATTNNTLQTFASSSFLTYLLTAFLSAPSTRAHLILPTRIDVDFRAACFCHRNVISIGFVCSICLSIFCSVPDHAECLTCGTKLTVGQYGKRPVVVRKKKRKKMLRDGSAVGTPTG